MEYADDNQENVQIIVVNNGYTEELPADRIRTEFDGDGNKRLPYGLIDDI